MTRCLRCMGAETRIRRFMARRSDNGTHGLRHAGDDAFQLTVDYLKQETIDPLRGIGRYLSMGIAGAFFLAFGIFLILIGILRLLQTETGTALTGNWSWVPYAVVFVLGGARHRRGRLAHHRRSGAGADAGGGGSTGGRGGTCGDKP